MAAAGMAPTIRRVTTMAAAATARTIRLATIMAVAEAGPTTAPRTTMAGIAGAAEGVAVAGDVAGAVTPDLAAPDEAAI